MSENGEHRDNERADASPKWVWWSTEESVERGAISVLACAEVAAGIGLYWWFLPWALGTNLHLLISVLVAPLLLLRSPASQEAALAAFEQYARPDEALPLRSTRGAFAMLLAAGLCVLAAWGLAESWLSGHDGWSLFWRAGIVGWINLQIGFAVVVAALATITITGVLVRALAGTLAGTIVGAGVLAGAGTVAVAVAGALAIALVGALAGIKAVAKSGIANVAVGPGIVLGIWLRSVTIKIGSTVRHLAEGWARLSGNWRALVWAHDLRRPPELLPGIERRPKLRVFGIGDILSRYKSGSGERRVLTIFVNTLAVLIFFLPAWLYRLSLKSTCWFWWPLVFSQTSGWAASRAVAEGGTPGADVVFEEHAKPWLAKLLFGLSLTLLVAAIGVPERLLTLLPVSTGGVDLLGALGNMIYLMLPCAGVQLALFLLCDRFLARAKAGHLGSWPRTAFRWLIGLRQFLLWSALFAALALHLENWVPVLTPFAELVETHYFSWFPLLAWT